MYVDLSRLRGQSREQQQQRVRRQHRLDGERRRVVEASAQVRHLRQGAGDQLPLPRASVPEAAGDPRPEGAGGGQVREGEQEELRIL